MNYSTIDRFILYNEEKYKIVQEIKENKRIAALRNEIYDELEAVLSEEHFELFNKFADLMIDEHTNEINSFFKAGIKVGARFVSECMFDWTE